MKLLTKHISNYFKRDDCKTWNKLRRLGDDARGSAIGDKSSIVTSISGAGNEQTPADEPSLLKRLYSDSYTNRLL